MNVFYYSKQLYKDFIACGLDMHLIKRRRADRKNKAIAIAKIIISAAIEQMKLLNEGKILQADMIGQMANMHIGLIRSQPLASKYGKCGMIVSPNLRGVDN